MAPRIPTLAMLLALAACATTAPRQVSEPDANAPAYLQGITTRYSLRLDEALQSAHRESALPGGLLAGDESLTLRAALFRSGEFYGLDLVLSNHEEHRIRLDRSKILLRDNAGRRLEPTHGYAGAEQHGLRGRTLARLDREDVPVPRDESTLAAQRPAREAPPSAGRKTNTGALTASTTRAPDPVPSAPDAVWFQYDNGPQLTTELPQIVDVDPEKTRTYWTYFSAEGLAGGVQYPLYLTVSVNGRKMLLKFEG